MQHDKTHVGATMRHSRLPLKAPSVPTIGTQEFKDAMAKLAFSVSIVTARHSDEQMGRTVTSFMPLSAEPPRILISIDLRSRLVDVIAASRGFSISFLSSGQEPVGNGFAGQWPPQDRFSLADWDYWPSGNPRLADALLSMDCELVGAVDAGDHMLFIGAITEMDKADRHDVMLWNRRAYLVPNRE